MPEQFLAYTGKGSAAETVGTGFGEGFLASLIGGGKFTAAKGAVGWANDGESSK